MSVNNKRGWTGGFKASPLDSFLRLLDVWPRLLRVMRKSLVRHRKKCWVWKGTINVKGYGNFRGRAAHRVAYEMFIGPVPDKQELHHQCGNPFCVNPWHLEPLTPKEHKRKWAATLTHCPHGHPFNEENSYWYGPDKASRKCKICMRKWIANWTRKNPGKTKAYKKRYLAKLKERGDGK